MSDVPQTPAAASPPNSPAAVGPQTTGPRSGAVTAVAVVNFVVGVVEILFAIYICLLFGGGHVGRVSGLAWWTVPGGVLAGLAIALVVVAVIKGLFMGVAGWGVLKRQPWGRILTLILGGLAVLVALGSINPLNPLGLVIYAGYAALVFSVLLGQRYAAEFFPGRAGAANSGHAAVAPTELPAWIASKPLWLLVVLLAGTHLVCFLAGAGLAGGGNVQDRTDISNATLFEQEGKIPLADGADQEGMVNFPYPYAIAPNVEINVTWGQMQITECKATGFKWKGKGQPNSNGMASARWRANGLKARKLPKETTNPTT